MNTRVNAVYNRIRTDRHGIAVCQESINGWDCSYNPDDDRWHVGDWNEYGDLITRRTFQGTIKGFQNMRGFCKKHKPRNPR